MNYEELYQKITNGDYESKLPYPPYRPDKKDRESLKDVDRVMRDDYRTDEHRLRTIFEADLRKYIEYEVGKPLTDKQYSAIFSKAWEDGHSNGYSEVLIEASNLVDVVKVFLQ